MRAWAWTFVWLTVAGFAGGTYHGLFDMMPATLSAGLWKVTVYSIGLADASLVAAIVFSVFSPRYHRAALVAIGAKLALYLLWTWKHDTFKYVIYDYAPSLVCVLLVALLVCLPRRVAGSGWIAAGIVVSFAAAAVQLGGRGFHRNFNHNDLYHVVQMVAMFFLYRGGRLLRDRTEEAHA